LKLYDLDNRNKDTITKRQVFIEYGKVPAISDLQPVDITQVKSFLGKHAYDTKDFSLQNGIGLPASTIQNAAAYAAFANGGTYYETTYIDKIETADGQVNDYSSSGKRVMQSSTAYMITDMLKQVITSSNGSGTAANISGLYQAGKTGTTAYPSDVSGQFPSDAAMDSWFDGYTKHYSISVWVGYDHQYEPGNYVPNNSKLAQQIYK